MTRISPHHINLCNLPERPRAKDGLEQYYNITWAKTRDQARTLTFDTEPGPARPAESAQTTFSWWWAEEKVNTFISVPIKTITQPREENGSQKVKSKKYILDILR